MSKEIYDQLIYVQAHCDAKVLHSPGLCEYCDEYPQAQAKRKELGVRFTDEVGIKYNDPTFEDGRLPCPAVEARPSININAWGGNVPKGPNVPSEYKENLKKIESLSSQVFYYDWTEEELEDAIHNETETPQDNIPG